MAAYVVKVVADQTNTAFGVAATFTDITADALSTGIGSAITINSWKQDRYSDVGPSTATVVLNNTSGNYTPVTKLRIGHRFRISATIAGVQNFLMDGYVTSAVESLSGAKTPIVTVTLVDILGRFGNTQNLYSIYDEECLATGPTSYYPFNDSASATSAVDLTGNKPPAALVMSKYATTGTATFADAEACPPAVNSTGLTLTTGAGGGGYLLQIQPSQARLVDSTHAFYSGGWLKMPVPTNSVAAIVSASIGQTITALLSVDNAGTVHLSALGAASSTFTTPSIVDGNWHHVVLEGYINAGTMTYVVYVDGVAVLTTTATVALIYDSVTLFGITTGGLGAGDFLGGSFYGWMYVYQLTPTSAQAITPTQVANLYTAGKTAFAGESTSAHISRLLTYRPNVWSNLTTGVGTVGMHDTNGASLQQALIDTGNAEGTMVYVDGLLKVTNIPRSVLFNPAVSVTADGTIAGEATPDTQWRSDQQNIANDVTVQRPGGSDARAFDTTSRNQYGIYQQDATRIVNSDQVALDHANFIVQTNKTPAVDSPSLVVNIYTVASTTFANTVLAATPYSRIQLINAPATTPNLDGLIVGRIITLAVDQFTVEFVVAPNPLVYMVADDATKGVSDGANVAAF